MLQKRPSASQEKALRKAAPQQTRARLTTVELKLHQTAVSVQKYPACGMMDSQQEGPKNTPDRDLCLQEQRD